MLKGKTEIQLTDVDTGYTQHYYDENMVTNALSDIFTLNTATNTDFLLGSSSTYSAGFGGSLYATALGGILLFDSTLEEDASNYFAPAGVQLVGSGVYNDTSASTDTVRGVYNASESVLDEDNGTMKYVYDFTTSQANGTIRSVCLTSNYAGYGGYGADALDTTQKSATLTRTSCTRHVTGTNYGEYPVLWDYDNDICYTAQVEVPSTGKLTLTMRKRRANFHSISVIHDNATFGKILASNAIVLSGYCGYSESASSSSAYPPNLNYDPAEGKFYFIYNASSSSAFSSGSSISICTISPGDLSYVTSTITNNTGQSLYTYNCLAAYDEYFYWCYSTTYVYKIDASSGDVVAEIPAPVSSSYSRAGKTYVRNGKIYVPSAKYTYTSAVYWDYLVIDVGEETAKLTTMRTADTYTTNANYYQIAPVLGKPWLYSLAYSYNSSYNIGKFQVLQTYLATINNLSTAVTKASNQTMKLTYTISES